MFKIGKTKEQRYTKQKIHDKEDKHDVTFGSLWCNRVAAKQEDSQNTAPCR